MKLVSFDIGIKNMAYCVFEISGNMPFISSWDIINLTDQENIDTKCNCLTKDNSICNKNAMFYHENNYFCRTHSKKSDLKVLEKPIKINKSLSIEKLNHFCSTNNIIINFQQKKDKIIQDINRFVEKNFLKTIIKTKKKNSNQYDLIDLGFKIKNEFNNVNDFNSVTHVIIENQISPIANRMKTLQGMVAQYFIMKLEKIYIEFISSSNKLKNFETDEKTYKENKKNGVFYCNKVLENNKNIYQNYLNYLSNYKKKDDLADCFLQGIWYVKFKNNICCNLNIN